MTAIQIEQLYRKATLLHIAVEGLARAFDLPDARVLARSTYSRTQILRTTTSREQRLRSTTGENA